MSNIRCLVLSDTFPNRLEPWRGPYNRRQIEELARLCRVSVINPLPWTRLVKRPGHLRLLGRKDTVLQNVEMWHPAWFYMPVIARSRVWRGVLGAARRGVDALGAADYDVVLATFAYPHGRAALDLAGELGVPYVIKARGSDLHQLPPGTPVGERCAEALRGASAVVAVSRNLADLAESLGAPADRIQVLHNAIDADEFTVIPRQEARSQVGAAHNARLVLYVGALRHVKGTDILAEAASQLDGDTQVYAAGDGPMRGELNRSSLHLLGRLSRRQVALWMNAADVVVLPSRNEGCPNVVLEALACGTPVVATRVGAVPDLLDERSGVIVAPESSEALAAGMEEALDRSWDRAEIRARVADNTWQQNARRLHGILRAAIEESL